VRLTTGRLNRATLARQLLLRRAALPVAEAVRRIGAVQAQEAASPYIGLWNRVAGFEPGELDTAFADGTVVKASLMRITLHAVHADDHPAFHAAMVRRLRASRLHDRRFTSTGLTAADVDALLPHLLDYAASPRTRAEAEQLCATRLGEARTRAWWALKTFAPLLHSPTGGPWSFGRHAAYVAAPHRLPDAEFEESVRHLVRRYLAAFGPASVLDIAAFSLLTRPVVRAAVDAIADELVRLEGPDGVALLDLPGAPLPDEDVPAPPRLLPMWDSVLLAHHDRGRVISPEHRGAVIRRNGDVLPTLLVDGRVAGVWRPIDGGGIEASAFAALPDGTWDGLAAEAAALGALLADRDPAVYRRYAHWWRDLPAAEVRPLR
jgi:hypothetical protein